MLGWQADAGPAHHLAACNLADAETAARPTESVMTNLMEGFPPAPDGQVTLANWRNPPFSRWAFQHVRELINLEEAATAYIAWWNRQAPGAYDAFSKRIRG